MSALAARQAAPEDHIFETGAFEIWQTDAGAWMVRGPQDCCGGIFVDEGSARRFVRDEARVRGTAASPAPVAASSAAARSTASGFGRSQVRRSLRAPPMLRAVGSGDDAGRRQPAPALL